MMQSHAPGQLDPRHDTTRIPGKGTQDFVQTVHIFIQVGRIGFPRQTVPARRLLLRNFSGFRSLYQVWLFDRITSLNMLIKT